MSGIGPERWRDLSPHLDHALDLPPGDRATWLEAVRAEDPALAADLGRLLDSHEAIGSGEFLAGAAPLPERTSLAGLQVGDYTLRAPLGHGGMGHVWLAERSETLRFRVDLREAPGLDVGEDGVTQLLERCPGLREPSPGRGVHRALVSVPGVRAVIVRGRHSTCHVGLRGAGAHRLRRARTARRCPLQPNDDQSDCEVAQTMHGTSFTLDDGRSSGRLASFEARTSASRVTASTAPPYGSPCSYT